MSALSAACQRLQDCEDWLQARVPERHTLAPDRARPTPLPELARALLCADDDPALIAAFAEGLERTVRAQQRHYPHNLLWDFDYLAATLCAVARREGVAALGQYVELYLELQRTFGAESVIRFRYVHDFIYGFDWERFVTRDPEHNADIGPLDLAFLRRVLERGQELREAVESGDDPDYPPLPPGQWRNPFTFSRVPEHELRLHRDLASRGLIPVQAWRVDARPDWRKPYTKLRRERAQALGLPALSP